MAAQRNEIDLVELEKLCSLQCTDQEIAAWFNVSTRTIERRRHEPAFAEAMTRGKAKGRISIRRMQMKLLEQGNATMGVWLGKQVLGQTDHKETSSLEPTCLRPLQELSVEELNAVLKRYAAEYPGLLEKAETIEAEYSLVRASANGGSGELVTGSGDGI